MLVSLIFLFRNKHVNFNNLTFRFLGTLFWVPIPINRYEIRSEYGPATFCRKYKMKYLYFPVQASYLGEFSFTSFRRKFCRSEHCCPIRSRNSLIINICERNASMSFIFRMEIPQGQVASEPNSCSCMSLDMPNYN